MLGSADYTATDGLTVVLASGATAGDLVEVISMSVSSVLNAIPASPASVQTSYLVDGSVTQAKVATGVAGTGPAFFATNLTNSAPSINTWTKITATTELFDTANCYASSRFTPNVAGYYCVNASAQVDGALTSGNYMDFSLYKNGSSYGVGIFGYNTVSYAHAGSSTLVFMNGTTDYLEFYFYATQALGLGKISFGAFLARAA
jgi:hypothetical protein